MCVENNFEVYAVYAAF